MTDTTRDRIEGQPEPAALAILADRLDEVAASLVEWFARIPAAPLDQLLDSRLACVQCAAEQHRAVTTGIPEDQLPGINVANVIAGGNSMCFAHIQFTDRPVMPGQTASGLFLAGPGRGM